jgi:hypothetical protein
VKLSLHVRSGLGSDDHPAVAGEGAAVALVAERTAAGAVRALVSFQAPAEVALTLRSLREAMALTADVPELGLCASWLLLDVPPPGIRRGPNRVGPAPSPAPELVMGGQATAEVVLDPRPDRPVTLWLRAAFRDVVSAPCKVELGPRPQGPEVPA